MIQDNETPTGAQMPQDIAKPSALLGGLSPTDFMMAHWQKKPLLIRGAHGALPAMLSRAELFDWACREGVESRLIEDKAGQWAMRKGPFTSKILSSVKTPTWTLLVQGAEVLHPAVADLLSAFRFLPDARLDDAMVSWASAGGGVGPHFDSYDVFLLQLSGTRRWQIGPQKDLRLQADMPLKLLAHFEPEETHLLGPGDMLYLPPKWAHNGVAQGDDCITLSVGFKAPARGGLLGEVLLRLGEMLDDETLYSDPNQPATREPARMPAALGDFARDAIDRVLTQPLALACALGEVMTDPKPGVWFEAPEAPFEAVLGAGLGIRVNVKTRLLYDDGHVFINGESYVAGGHDFELLRQLANHQQLGASDLGALSADALTLVSEWYEAGWVDAQV